MFCDNFAIILILPTALDRPYCMVKNAVRQWTRNIEGALSPNVGGMARALSWNILLPWRHTCTDWVGHIWYVVEILTGFVLWSTSVLDIPRGTLRSSRNWRLSEHFCECFSIMSVLLHVPKFTVICPPISRFYIGFLEYYLRESRQTAS